MVQISGNEKQHRILSVASTCPDMLEGVKRKSGAQADASQHSKCKRERRGHE